MIKFFVKKSTAMIVILLALSLYLYLSLSLSTFCVSENIIIDFPFFTISNLTLVGDSYLRNGIVGLTKDLLHFPTTSSGAVFYARPIAFFEPETALTASFSTRFTFSIDTINPFSSGDGLAFFLSQRNPALGSTGWYLGLMNSSRRAKNRFLAIEFDTKMDLIFDDPDDNHVGLDIDSPVSIKAANPFVQAINLKSGNLITAWIDYVNELKKIEVFLSYSGFKPDKPLLSVNIDLSDYLKESMFVGFSASANRSTEQHFIDSWSFRTSGLHSRKHLFNVSDNAVPLKTPSSFADDQSERNRWIGLGLGICFFILIAAAAVVLSWMSLRGKGSSELRINVLDAEVVTGPRQFSYKELKVATAGFHQSRILGYGSFGTVYKAFFVDLGLISAVKKSKHSHESKAEFLVELSIIACLRHKNLVQLQGWCADKDELLLVYEFMSNGSLDKVLHQCSESGNPLEWSHRYNIALGLASALNYLHEECEQQVIHRDVKSSNIMLDASYNAKLGDFGLARLMDHGKSPVSTLTAGTMGYLAPEYLQYGKATDKTDVFSYGVVILELACGKKPIEREVESRRMVNLVDWVWRLHAEGNLIAAADKRMKGEFNEVEMKRMLLLGLNCANPDDTERVSMRRVLQILNKEAEGVAVPKAKPRLGFSSSVVCSISDIVSECEGDCETPPESHLQIRVS